MDADASSNHNRNVSTWPKLHCVWIHALSIFLQHLPRPSSVWTMSLHSSESTTKDHLPLVFQCWIILAHQYVTCMYVAVVSQFFYDKIRTNKRGPLKGQLRRSLQSSQPMTASSDVCLHELTSASDDHAGVFFYFCMIVCTLPKYFAVFCCHWTQRCNYMILTPVTFKPYNLNSIHITNVSTGTHGYNAQT